MKLLLNPPDPGCMTGAELRVVRDGLGLSGPQLARLLDVNDRTVRRWELDEAPVPEGVRLQIERYEAYTADLIQTVINELLAMQGDVGIVTYRDDESYWADEPGMKPWPASWQRTVVYRVAQEIPGLEIVYSDAVAFTPLVIP